MQRVNTFFRSKIDSLINFLPLIVLVSFCGIFSVQAQNVLNGSFTGTTGNSITPPSWNNVLGYNPGTNLGVSPTVDVLDINFTAYFNNAAVAVSPSPDGGTWTGISSIPPDFENEAIDQVVTGFTIGTQYQLSFYAANFGGTPFIDPGIVTAYVNGTAVAVSPTLNLTANVWTTVTGTFVASATSMTVHLDAIHTTGNGGVGGYYDVDGLTIVPTIPCGAGNTAPTLSQTSLCLITATYNLNNVTASNTPAGTTLTWHTATPATNGNTVGNPSAVSSGVYYAAFYDAVNDCYSPTQPFTLNPLPVADFSTPSVCIGSAVNFTDESTVGLGSVNQWNWAFGDGNTSNVQNPTHTYSGGNTSYNVTLTVTSAAGCSNSVTLPITFSNPVASFTYSPTNPDVLNPTVQFTNTSTNATTYDWDFGGLGGSTQTNPSFNFPNIANTYTVTLIAYAGNCTDTTTALITVNDVLIYSVPNVFSPDNDGINDTFQVDTENASAISVTIVNRWGEFIKELDGLTETWDGTFNGKEASEGVYFFTYTITDKAEKTIEGHGFVQLIRK
ncbi:MAG: gliding motility-associated C-terminal domain-containing protein [Fluviicola sp.]|nr:gliding motility-associated C-terminal domain-containing protein [Fluviicola sp.]